jgi:hypothetical protein
MHLETGLENVPEIIQCCGLYGRGIWTNISGVKFTATEVHGPYGSKKYRYTFNNLWNNSYVLS